MMLNDIMKEYIQSVCKTMHSKLKESPVACPCTHVELDISDQQLTNYVLDTWW